MVGSDAHGLEALLESTRSQYSVARKKALKRQRLGILCSLILGFSGVAILSLKAYDLLQPLLEVFRCLVPANIGAMTVDHATGIATILLLAGVGLARLIRQRGYLNQLLRYSFALSEIDVLKGLFGIRYNAAANEEERHSIEMEYAQKLAAVVRKERKDFAVSTRHDFESMLERAESAATTDNKRLNVG